MADLTRDALAEAIVAIKTETAAHGDVRVDLAKIAGSIDTLTTEVRLGREADRQRQEAASEELEAVKSRVSVLERQFWRAVGAVGAVGTLAGALGGRFL